MENHRREKREEKKKALGIKKWPNLEKEQEIVAFMFILNRTKNGKGKFGH